MNTQAEGNNASEIWQSALPYIKNNVSVTGFKTTFPNVTAVAVRGNTLVLCAKHDLYKGMLESMYANVIKQALLDVTGRIFELEVVVGAEASGIAADDTVQETAPVVPAGNHINPANNLNSRFTFDSFVVGTNNNFACAAAIAVAEFPAQKYNPLLVYGGTGLGKTHLLHAVGNSIYARHPDWKIMCTTAEKFMNNFVDAIRNENNQEFRNKYRSIDLLLIDDIQFFAGKEGTQEEFFHTFNELINCNKQIMLTSDRPAKDIYPLEERLRTRLAGGLTVDIQIPDYETRLAIIHKKIENESFTPYISDEIYSLVAQQVKSNIRELEGAIRTIVAYSQISKTEIDVSVANKILNEYFSDTQQHAIDIDTIRDETEKHFKLAKGSLTSQKRDRDIAYPRQIAMYLCRELIGTSFPEIGAKFGGRDHTTVMYAYRKVKAELENDSALFNTIHILTESVLQH